MVAANGARLADYTWTDSYQYTCQRTWSCSGVCDPYRGVQVHGLDRELFSLCSIGAGVKLCDCAAAWLRARQCVLLCVGLMGIGWGGCCALGVGPAGVAHGARCWASRCTVPAWCMSCLSCGSCMGCCRHFVVPAGQLRAVPLGGTDPAPTAVGCAQQGDGAVRSRALARARDLAQQGTTAHPDQSCQRSGCARLVVTAQGARAAAHCVLPARMVPLQA